MYIDPKQVAKRIITKFCLVLFAVMLALYIAAVSHAPLFTEARAQDSGPSLQERQVIALEKIASEMSRMRREKCR
jgi:type II secretory pathway component PulK